MKIPRLAPPLLIVARRRALSSPLKKEPKSNKRSSGEMKEKTSELELKREEIKLEMSHPEREASVLKNLRVRAPHSEGVLMRLLNAYLCRCFINKRLSQQAFNSKIHAPHSAGVLIN